MVNDSGAIGNASARTGMQGYMRRKVALRGEA